MTRNPPSPSDALTPWQAVADLADLSVRQRVGALMDAQATALAALFYDRMLVHPQAGQLLDHTLVNQRLHASMTRWCRTLFCTDTPLAELLAI